MSGPGRPTGATSKLKQQLIARLDARFPEWHPVIQMADVANDESLDIQTRFNAAKEVAQYVTPKLKAVEVSGDQNSPLIVKIVHFGDNPTK